jgi:hypothetical protein
MESAEYKNEKKFNCYNYALKNYKIEFMQPGELSNLPLSLTDVTCNRIKQNIINDLKPDKGYEIDVMNECKQNEWKICLFIWSSKPDYHFYRQDGPNSWSHKFGESSPTKKDKLNEPIKQILSANTGPYNFCSCFCVNDKMKHFEKN